MSKPENKNPLANLSPAQIEALHSLIDQECARLARVRAHEEDVRRMEEATRQRAEERIRQEREQWERLRAAAAKVPREVFGMSDQHRRKLLILHPEAFPKMPRPLTPAEEDAALAKVRDSAQFKRAVEQKGYHQAVEAWVRRPRQKEISQFFDGLESRERKLCEEHLQREADPSGFIPEAVLMVHDGNWHAMRAAHAARVFAFHKETGVCLESPQPGDSCLPPPPRTSMPVDVEGLRAGAARVL